MPTIVVLCRSTAICSISSPKPLPLICIPNTFPASWEEIGQRGIVCVLKRFSTITPTSRAASRKTECRSPRSLSSASRSMVSGPVRTARYGAGSSCWPTTLASSGSAVSRRWQCRVALWPYASLGGTRTPISRQPSVGSSARQEYAELDLIGFLVAKPLATLQAMMSKGINSPLSSSCGRLFDAVAAAIGICREEASYEGQAAIELEACVDETATGRSGRIPDHGRNDPA